MSPPRPEVEVTHPDRVLFPGEAITKGDLVEHYLRVAPLMLRQVAGRPLTLQRYPRGIAAKGFIQQDVSASSPPPWLELAEVPRESGGTVVHAVANRPEALAWLANQDCLTAHVWLSRTGRLHSPDRMVVDLDPSDGDFSPVRDTALSVRDTLRGLGLAAFVQLTGSRGVHVVTPLSGRPDFDTVRDTARRIAELVAAQDPANRTVAARKTDRRGRVYLDVMRNGYAQTVVAPYAVRARPGAPVATPIGWDELGEPGLRADRYTLRNLPARLAGRADPWADLPRRSRSLTRVRQKLARLGPGR